MLSSGVRQLLSSRTTHGLVRISVGNFCRNIYIPNIYITLYFVCLYLRMCGRSLANAFISFFSLIRVRCLSAFALLPSRDIVIRFSTVSTAMILNTRIGQDTFVFYTFLVVLGSSSTIGSADKFIAMEVGPPIRLLPRWRRFYGFDGAYFHCSMPSALYTFPFFELLQRTASVKELQRNSYGVDTFLSTVLSVARGCPRRPCMSHCRL